MSTEAMTVDGGVAIGKDIWEYKKYNHRQQDDKHLTVLRNSAKIHQKHLQTYHDLITNNKKQDRSLYTAQYWANYLILRRIKDDPDLIRGQLGGVKPKIIELDRKIGHKNVMSICKFFMDRGEPSHLVY